MIISCYYAWEPVHGMHMKGETPSPTYNPDNIIDFFAPITTEWQPSFKENKNRLEREPTW